MSGQTERILTELVLDFDEFRAELREARKQADKDGKGIGKKIKDGLKDAAHAATIGQFTMERLKEAYQAVSDSVTRMSSRRGDTDPAVMAFQRLETSATRTFDSMVEGVLKSDAVQSALNAAADMADSLARSAVGLGEKFDAWVNKHAPSIAKAMSAVYELYLRSAAGFKASKAAFKSFAGLLAESGAAVLGFLRSTIETTGALALAISEDLGNSIFGAAGKVGAAEKKLREVGNATTARGVVDLEKAMLEIAGISERVDATFKSIVETIRASTDKPDTLRESIFDVVNRDVASKVLTAADGIATSVGDSFASAFERIKGLFGEIATLMQGRDFLPQLRGLESLFGGFSGLAVQAEGAFGKSGRAAEIFAKAQLALAAITATVQGTMQLAEGQSNIAEGNGGAAALNFASAGTFFAAATLASGRAAGA
ncbi:MAG: hypothetical protein ACPGWS_10090, partial [Solirubrobacterales bacterium]